MRGAATVIAIALSLGGGACAVGVNEPGPQRLEPGRPVDLRVGESAATADGRLRVGFERVSADSRCPKNVRCVWAGDATVRIWLQRGTGAREAHELHTAPAGAQGLPEPGVRLVKLEPVPVEGRALEARDYVATLVLDSAPAAPER